jgi:hypothetical protein
MNPELEYLITLQVNDCEIYNQYVIDSCIGFYQVHNRIPRIHALRQMININNVVSVEYIENLENSSLTFIQQILSMHPGNPITTQNILFQNQPPIAPFVPLVSGLGFVIGNSNQNNSQGLSVNGNFVDVPVVLDDTDKNNLEAGFFETLKDKSGISDQCGICIEDFEDDDLVTLLPCKHIYHCVCSDKWFSENSNKCPICREECGKSKPKL